MPDRESVITHLMIMETWTEYALEVGRNFFEESHIKNICEWAGEALELLKEQEPVAPSYAGYNEWFCGNCGETVGWKSIPEFDEMQYKYCPYCGKKVKWDA